MPSWTLSTLLSQIIPKITHLSRNKITYTQSLANVLAPAIPSEVRPCFDWYDFTADFVELPNTPSKPPVE